MADTKSKEYPITGVGFDKVAYSFDKVTGELSGAKEKTSDGRHKPLNPTSNDFTKVIETDEAVNAYNIANFKGETANYISEASKIEKLSQEELLSRYNKDLKAFNNASSVATIDNYRSGRNIADSGGTYIDNNYQHFRKNYAEEKQSKIFAYPLDIDIKQDHFKITRYKYLRSDVNASKPRRVERLNKKEIEVAGDSLIGSKSMGSIILPMPKATDVNAVEWGKSELNASGLLALGSATMADRIASFNGRLPRTTQITLEQQRAQNKLKEDQERGGNITSGGGLGVLQAAVNQTNVTIASLLTGQELDQDTFLARTGGHVLNPNAEMLFQGPTIRNFAFTFLMVARSQQEGAEIRNLIRFLKLGMAPKFRNTTFLANPDIFTLEYKNGKGEKDILKTVNRFSPGGLALNSLAVDYAPSGYWAAYRDSQPVALKLDMTFSELRPIYEGDQSDPELEGSVGY
jgi:hypothetical protein